MSEFHFGDVIRDTKESGLPYLFVAFIPLCTSVLHANDKVTDCYVVAPLTHEENDPDYDYYLHCWTEGWVKEKA